MSFTFYSYLYFVIFALHKANRSDINKNGHSSTQPAQIQSNKKIKFINFIYMISYLHLAIYSLLFFFPLKGKYH